MEIKKTLYNIIHYYIVCFNKDNNVYISKQPILSIFILIVCIIPNPIEYKNITVRF